MFKMFKKRDKPYNKEIQEYIKKLVKEYEEKVEDYEAKLSALCDRNMDYMFLKQLMKEVALGTGESITVTLKDGTVIRIDKELDKKSNWDLNYK